METIQIKSWLSGKVLFEHTQEGNSVSITLQAGIKAGANLAGAYLARANLDGANLAGANLDGANLDGEEKLTGERPIIQIGPIGSRCAYLVAYLTDGGIRIRAGCFFGTKKEFVAKVKETHGDNEHAQEYKAALKLIDLHAKLWTPK